MMRYSYKVEHISGKDNVIAGALSKSSAKPTIVEERFVAEMDAYAMR